MNPHTTTPVNNSISTTEDFGLLSIKGPDASKFLQGQVTCDLRELTADQALLGAQCTLKGRVIANFLLIAASPEEIYLRLPKSLAQKVCESLGKYIVFSKAKITNLSDEFSSLTFAGKEVNQSIKQNFGIELSKTHQWQQREQGILIRLGENHWEYWQPKSGETANAPANATQIATGQADPGPLELIRSGIATILPETTELFTPQDLSLTEVNAVSFKKGCYTGQEIVARMHYRGTQKRRLYRIEGAFTPALESLLSAGKKLVNSTGKDAGNLVNFSKTNDSTFEALVSAFDEHIDDLYIEGSTEKLVPLKLPYAIPKN